MKKYILFIPFLLILLVSCEKELEFQYHDIVPVLVIEGTLTQERATVALSLTTPMNEKIEPDYLTDAEVYIIDENNNGKIVLTHDSIGVYTGDYPATPGKQYRLVVNRFGKEYRSNCVLRPSTQILGLKFQWIKMPYDHVAVLQITFKDLKNDEDCYWVKIYRNDSPYKWILSDDRSAVNGIITESVMTSRKDLDKEDDKDILREGDEVKVTVNAISREMYDYLTAIQNNSNGPSMFEGEFCLGYFMAADSATDSIIFHPDELTQYP